MQTTSYAEGKVIDFEGEEKIDAAILETFSYLGHRQVISYETSEFSAVCPFSGLPDIGDIIITYIPNEKIVELKSLKYYFLSYRNVGIYQEPMTSRVFDDLWTLLQPSYLKVESIYNTRGGIDTTCYVEKGIFSTEEGIHTS